MASLPQSSKIHELIALDYQTIENPEYKVLAPMDIPIGGPVIMKTPDGKYIKVMTNGSVEPYDMV